MSKQPKRPRDQPLGLRFWLPMTASVAALVISGFQWKDANQLKNLTVQPTVDFYLENDAKKPKVGWMVTNSGPGPAQIQSVNYVVDHTRVSNLDEAADRSGINSELVDGVEFDKGDFIGVGKSQWIFFIEPPKGQDATTKSFIAFADDHLGIEFRYCSLSGDCFTKCTWQDRCMIKPAQSH